MHTRFEHSLGVMHVATLLYDSIVRNSSDVLKSVYQYTDIGLERDRQKVRLAALLHDVGHCPFSHAAEDVFPERPLTESKSGLVTKAKRYKHEDYSFALIRHVLRDVIDGDEWNRRNYGITADEIAAIIEGSSNAGPALFWKDLLNGQLDADRMDYLLRDTYHIGVNYGKFDLHRVVATVRAVKDDEKDRELKTPRIGISSGGWYAAEALILARYSMHKQVYFHKTRKAYDIHVREAMKAILPGGHFPPPTPESLGEYLKWDDWKVWSLLSEGKGGEHGQRLLNRNHYRLIYSTRDNPRAVEGLAKEDSEFSAVQKALGELVVATEKSSNNWYKRGSAVDIPVINEHDPADVSPLSEYSSLLSRFTANEQHFLYVKPEDVVEAKHRRDEAIRKLKEVQIELFSPVKRKEVASA